jgi:hypothetical protein
MLLFKPTVITTLCFSTITVTGAPTVVDHVLDPRSNLSKSRCQRVIFVHAIDTVAYCTAAASLVLPTIPNLTNQLKLVMPPDKSLFWSGPGPSSYTPYATFYAKHYNLKTTLDYGDREMIELATNAGKDVLDEYWRRMSSAFSRASKGKAYVILPGDPAEGTSWYKGTIWDTIEWPLLKKNPAITQIFRVNPKTPPTQGVTIKPMWTLPPRRLE